MYMFRIQIKSPITCVASQIIYPAWSSKAQSLPHNKPAKFAAKFVANLGVSSSLLTPTANPGTLAVNC